MSVSKIVKLAKCNCSSKIRLYLVYIKKHYFIFNGKIETGFSANLRLTKNRNNILTAFSKMGFLFDEIIRIKIISYEDNSSSRELLYLLNLIPINKEIRIFLDWNIFNPSFTR